MTPNKSVTTLAPFIYGNVSEIRSSQTELALYLNHWTSRLRAALFYWTTHGLAATSGWWLQGLKNEMVCNYVMLKNIEN